MSVISFLSPFCSYMFHAVWNSTETRYGACRQFKWEIIVDKKKKNEIKRLAYETEVQ